MTRRKRPDPECGRETPGARAAGRIDRQTPLQDAHVQGGARDVLKQAAVKTGATHVSAQHPESETARIVDGEQASQVERARLRPCCPAAMGRSLP